MVTMDEKPKVYHTSVIKSPERRPSVITETTNQLKSPEPSRNRSSVFPWSWSDYTSDMTVSPSGGSLNSIGSSPYLSSPETPNRDSSIKRGRPRADAINTLIIEGTTSPSSIRCKICNRVFPREKSVQAHMRTHTGERPYLCDFPGCSRRFAQSGQLKTHQRLHTGEKPFKCSDPGCTSRFTHANRHCTHHPYAILKRDESGMVCTIPNENTSEEVIMWLQRYRSEKGCLTPTRPKLKNFAKREIGKEFSNRTTVRRSVIRECCKDDDSQEGDQIMGALALIQLAKNASEELATPLNLTVKKPAE